MRQANSLSILPSMSSIYQYIEGQPLLCATAKRLFSSVSNWFVNFPMRIYSRWFVRYTGSLANGQGTRYAIFQVMSEPWYYVKRTLNKSLGALPAESLQGFRFVARISVDWHRDARRSKVSNLVNGLTDIWPVRTLKKLEPKQPVSDF